MGMIRNNKDSVLAMLEAFVHDPLINWRLLVRPSQDEVAGRSRSVSRSRRGSETGCRSRSLSISGLPDEVVGSLQTQAAPTDRVPAANARMSRQDAVDEWQHPASVIGTPALAPDMPESSSVTLSKWSRTEPMLVLQEQQDEQALNDRAVSVLRRVKSKLAGSDFPDQAVRLDVATQVHRLIAEAQSEFNLCQLYGRMQSKDAPRPGILNHDSHVTYHRVVVLICSWMVSVLVRLRIRVSIPGDYDNSNGR